jgi:uncharacterized protein with ParB-like and HNH nuclease domain
MRVDELTEELEDLKNITDDQEDVVTTSDLFSISSFGVDYPVETLVSRMDKELFYIPDFQRQFVWSKAQSSRFIESLLLGLPVPGIFLFKEQDTGRHLVIDGQQRLKTLIFYYQNDFNGNNFKLNGLESEWNNKNYRDLDEADRARLDDAVIHATVFKQDLPEGDMNSVYEVFERINTGGTKLSPQEIRSCIFHGPFNDFLHRINQNPDWRAIYGNHSKRLRDIELVLRFFAFYENADEYRSPMKHFLNDYMKDNRNADATKIEELGVVFEQTFLTIRNSIGDRAFRPERSLNTAVFDSVACVIARRLQDGKSFNHSDLNKRYQELLRNDRFQEGYIRSTADPENVRRRFDEAFSAIG